MTLNGQLGRQNILSADYKSPVVNNFIFNSHGRAILKLNGRVSVLKHRFRKQRTGESKEAFFDPAHPTDSFFSQTIPDINKWLSQRVAKYFR
jgi:hypothetical protein